MGLADMASRPVDRQPIGGRVDQRGRLVSADPGLERLQRDAGSRLGAPLALPQLAAIVRIALQLKIPVSRRAVAAAAQEDIDMWVRAVPDDEGVALTIESWTPRPAHGPKLAGIAPDPIAAAEPRRWAVDEQLRVVSLSQSAADLLGISLSEAIGQPLTAVLRLEPGEAGEMPMLQALISRGAFAGQAAKRRDDDTKLLLSGDPAASDGSFTGFEGDIASADEPAEEGTAAVDPGFNEVLRSPLRHIIDAADRMADASDGPIRDEYADYAADISAAAHHLLSVVRGMGEEARRATVDLVELVGEATQFVEVAASERGTELAIESMPALKALGDPRAVIQILVNLIGNAIRYSNERGTVTVSFERSAGQSVVHVADNGPGIDPADHERIFQRFEQAGSNGQGSGLGLAIARRLARGMGGDIQLVSQPGAGARFSLRLPAA